MPLPQKRPDGFSPREILGAFLFIFTLSAVTLTAFEVSDSIKLAVYFSQMAVFTSLVYKALGDVRSGFREVDANLRGLHGLLRELNGGCRAARRVELYPSMTSALSHVDHAVYVTYFAPWAPDATGDADKDAYQAALERSFEARPHVEFQRIIGISKVDEASKRDWVQRQFDLMKAHSNYTVRLLVLDNAHGVVPQNVQIFDSFVFHVDPAGTRERAHPRDIHFHSKEVANIMEQYFRGLWREAADRIPEGYLSGGQAAAAFTPPPLQIAAAPQVSATPAVQAAHQVPVPPKQGT